MFNIINKITESYRRRKVDRLVSRSWDLHDKMFAINGNHDLSEEDLENPVIVSIIRELEEIDRKLERLEDLGIVYLG